MLTETKKVNMHKYFNCNNADTFLDIPNVLGDTLVMFQWTEPCIPIKAALEYCVMTILGIKYKTYQIFYKKIL